MERDSVVHGVSGGVSPTVTPSAFLLPCHIGAPEGSDGSRTAVLSDRMPPLETFPQPLVVSYIHHDNADVARIVAVPHTEVQEQITEVPQLEVREVTKQFEDGSVPVQSQDHLMEVPVVQQVHVTKPVLGVQSCPDDSAGVLIIDKLLSDFPLPSTYHHSIHHMVRRVLLDGIDGRDIIRDTEGNSAHEFVKDLIRGGLNIFPIPIHNALLAADRRYNRELVRLRKSNSIGNTADDGSVGGIEMPDLFE